MIRRVHRVRRWTGTVGKQSVPSHRNWSARCQLGLTWQTSDVEPNQTNQIKSEFVGSRTNPRQPRLGIWRLADSVGMDPAQPRHTRRHTSTHTHHTLKRRDEPSRWVGVGWPSSTKPGDRHSGSRDFFHLTSSNVAPSWAEDKSFMHSAHPPTKFPDGLGPLGHS